MGGEMQRSLEHRARPPAADGPRSSSSGTSVARAAAVAQAVQGTSFAEEAQAAPWQSEQEEKSWQVVRRRRASRAVAVRQQPTGQKCAEVTTGIFCGHTRREWGQEGRDETEADEAASTDADDDSTRTTSDGDTTMNDDDSASDQSCLTPRQKGQPHSTCAGADPSMPRCDAWASATAGGMTLGNGIATNSGRGESSCSGGAAGGAGSHAMGSSDARQRQRLGQAAAAPAGGG